MIDFRIKIIAICGSGRKHGSNTEWMIRYMLSILEKKGVGTELINLASCKIENCRGCDYCRKTGKLCKINDDMKRIYPKIKQAKGYIIGSPNYFKNVSGYMKTFMDRTNAFINVDKSTKKTIKRLSDKYVVGVCVGGEESNDTKYCEGSLKRFFKAHDMNLVGSVKARADSPLEVRRDKTIKAKMELACNALIKNISKNYEKN